MEAALGHEAAAAAQAAGAVPPPHQPAVAARQLSGTGLPPRGPAPRSHAGITLEAAFAAASASSAPSLGGGGLSRTRSDPTSFATAAADFGSSLRDGSRFSALAAVAAAASGERHLPSAEHENHYAADGTASAPRSVAGGSDAGSVAGSRTPIAQLPPWQSPARIPPVGQPVPPLPLSRLGGGSGGTSAASSSRGGTPGDLDLLPPPAAAPAGMLPPAPQPAVSSSVSRASSTASLVLAPNGPSLVPGSLIGGGGSGEVQPAAGGSGGRTAGQPAPASARRPAGLAALDTDSLTFETFGLESPDTITPGLQYARQVAQLFVEGRRCVSRGRRVQGAD